MTKKVHYFFKVDAFLFFESYNGENNSQIDNKTFIILTCIPIINFAYFIGCIHASLFYKLRYNNNKDYYIDYEIRMRSEKEHNILFLIISFLDDLASIFLSISLIILNIYFTLLLIIISLFSKFYPIKYLFGIAYSNNFIS